jgi:hypothetical protein
VNAILENSAYTLDMKAFKNGCMIPDMRSEYKIFPHYKNQSFDYLQTLIRNLIENKDDCDKNLSTQLGIISHYIVDYFCQVHNYPVKANIVFHLLYETKLMLIIRGAGLSDLCQQQYNALPDELPQSAEAITSLIEQRHLLYLREIPSCQNDIKYAVQTAFIVVASLLMTRV